MNTTTDATTANCPCDTFAPWQVITNTPGLSTLQYRVGDFLTFRHQLLLPLPDEQELINWRPSAKGDLALQMVEWWAYLADILTFYNERIANESYLRTADLDASVKRLIRILGYRPRPGIGAFGSVAALMSKPSPAFTLPPGFPLQSKPGPGKQPQIFEVSAATPISYPDVVDVTVAATPATSAQSVLLKGAITSIKANDELILVEDKWNGADQNYAVVTVQSTQQVKDPRGNINTQVTFTSQSDLSHIPADPAAANYHLMKSAQSAHVWQYAAAGVAFTDSSTQIASSAASNVVQIAQVQTTAVLTARPIGEIASQFDFTRLTARPIGEIVSQFDFTNDVHLDSIARQIKVGDPVLFKDLSGANASQLVDVTSYSEVIWYANPKNNTNPGVPPDPSTTNPPVPIPHAHLSFKPA
ncbi:MAG: hypothetical protein JO166_15570, partial [Deltaproteobacteria bacterium]|nr:hypothetical protein [Deltaproteobacteria bacterium]